MPKPIVWRHHVWFVLLLILAGCGGGATRTPANTPSPTISSQVAATPSLATPGTPGTPTAGIATPIATPALASPTLVPASPTIVAASPTAIPELRGAGMLLYLGEHDGKEGIVAVQADGSGRRLIAEGSYYSLQWAPDGSRFAAVVGDLSGSVTPQVVIFSADGQELNRHTFDEGAGRIWHWSPDSQLLLGLFASPGTGGGPIQVMAGVLSTEGLQSISLPQEYLLRDYYWLPDGQIALISVLHSAIPDRSIDPDEYGKAFTELVNSFWIVGSDGKNARKVYEGQQKPFDVADDAPIIYCYTMLWISGDDILFTEYHAVDLRSGTSRLVARATDLAAVVFQTNPGPTDAQAIFPSLPNQLFQLAPQTNRLAIHLLSDRDPRSSSNNPYFLNEGLVVLEPSGQIIYAERHPREEYIENFAWSPDGAKFAYIARDRDFQLQIVDLATSTMRALPIDGGGRSIWPALAWSPDGRWIAFGTDRGLEIVSVETPGSAYLLGEVGEWLAWQPVSQR